MTTIFIAEVVAEDSQYATADYNQRVLLENIQIDLISVDFEIDMDDERVSVTMTDAQIVVTGWDDVEDDEYEVVQPRMNETQLQAFASRLGISVTFRQV